ncbi:sodium-dependent transporter [Elongatibacter sediminis]|uniref:Transporter n=1 Tax=Elongatibacter sediminis TaxID=3119006 RepID=A0AAW9RBL4_9GAMM
MAESAEPFVHEHWKSRGAFLMACVGSAIGLGTIWRFPYITGVNGGGAFVLIYAACVLIIGIPLVAAEIALGRRGGNSAIRSMQKLATEEGASRFWVLLGWLSVLTPFVGLMLYSVIGGWVIDYAIQSGRGMFAGADAESSSAFFATLTSNPWRLLFWHTVFISITIGIVARGVNAGIARAVELLIPGLAVLLVVLLVYVLFTTDFMSGVRFLFQPDFGKVNATVVLMAIGQAFFSLSIAVGALITYGAYMPKRISIPGAACTIAVADTSVAILIGLVVFPLVITYGLEPGEGPGLVFVTLPIAFGSMPGGAFFGTVFFVLMLMTALTSSIGMLEPVVSRLVESRRMGRPALAVIIGGIAWLCGLMAVLSFNVLSGFNPLSWIPGFETSTLFDLLDFTAANLLIPAGGLLIALFAGWVMRRESIRDELGLRDGVVFRLWYALVRYVLPVAILIIAGTNLLGR